MIREMWSNSISYLKLKAIFWLVQLANCPLHMPFGILTIQFRFAVYAFVIAQYSGIKIKWADEQAQVRLRQISFEE